jgi:hypothetical protein
MTESQNNRQGKKPRFRMAIIFVGAILLVIVLISIKHASDLTSEQTTQALLSQQGQIPLQEMRAHEVEILTKYRQIDPARKTYGIPIARAMQLLVEESARASQTTLQK